MPGSIAVTAGPGPLSQDDGRRHFLPQPIIRHAEHNRFSNGRMIMQSVFDPGGGNFCAAPVDDVVQSPGDKQKSILVNLANVSCLEPSIFRSDICLISFVFLYSEVMLTMENMGLTSMEKPISPGTRKSMYLVCPVLTVVCVTPMMDVPP